MKKLFTLLMVLAVATVGYSQVKSASRFDAQKVAQKRVVTRSEGLETLQNVQAANNMMRDYETGDLDYTTYDWQSNCAARNWTQVWPDGKVNFAYTIASDENFTDRGTGIGTYDSNTGEWIPLGGRIETERTGFGSIARYKENGLVVAAHTSTECGIYIVEDKDNMAPNSVDNISRLDPAKDPAWPVVMTSGPDRDIIHVIATGSEDDMLYYYRTRDGGVTWDKQSEQIPFLTNEYAYNFGSNSCYFMETTEDNCLALVINASWSDGMVLYSMDDGDTWDRIVYYKHPGIDVTYTDIWFMYPRWSSCQWDSHNNLHVLYEFNGSTNEPGSGTYYPGIGGVSYWSNVMPYRGESVPYGFDPNNPMTPVHGQPFIMDSAYIIEDIYASWWRWSDATHEMWNEYVGYLSPLDANGQPLEDPYSATEFNIEDRTLHGSYNSGVAGFPVLVKVPGSDDMVAVWSAMDEKCNPDPAGNYYYHLYASASADGGRTWARQVALTNDIVFMMTEAVYPQAAVVNNQLVVAVQMDQMTGTFVQSDDDDPSDNLYQGLVFNLDELFPNAGLSTPEIQNTTMTIWPNPAVKSLNVNLNQATKIVVYNIMGQVVATQNGHIGSNSIDVSTLSSGVYTISAGNDIQKFVVK